MKIQALALTLLPLAIASTSLPAQPQTPATGSTQKSTAAKLPRLPAGVAELKFGDFFVTPVGPRGLELTDKLRQLDGQRVRILGYMVRQEDPSPGCFLLAPIPAQVHEHDNGLADDLPASTLLVISPSHGEQVVPHAPQLLLLTGTLEVGNRPEPGGRMSVVRLTIDRMSKSPGSRKATPGGKGAEQLLSRRDPTGN